MWDEYNKVTKNKPPRKLLVQAIGAGGYALDLGAGALNDTRYLLEKGYEVDAVDGNPSILDLGKDLKAKFFVSTFDAFDFPIAKYDLINAEYSLPFNPPETFDAMFAKLVASLKQGGIFVGQFFGVEDSWSKTSRSPNAPSALLRGWDERLPGCFAGQGCGRRRAYFKFGHSSPPQSERGILAETSKNKKMTFHTKEEVETFFKEFSISHFEEVKKEGKDGMGNEKFWHYFDVIAVR